MICNTMYMEIICQIVTMPNVHDNNVNKNNADEGVFHDSVIVIKYAIRNDASHTIVQSKVDLVLAPSLFSLVGRDTSSSEVPTKNIRMEKQ